MSNASLKRQVLTCS